MEDEKCGLSLFVFEVNDLTHHNISGNDHEQNDLAPGPCLELDQILSRLGLFCVVGTCLKFVN